MISTLYIIGAGSVGRHIIANLEHYNLEYKRVLLIDDNLKIGTVILGIQVIGNVDHLKQIEEPSDVIIGIAFPDLKKNIFEIISKNNYLDFPSIISNRAWISEGVSIGKGVIIYPNSSINYATKISDFVILNMNCALGHNCEIGRYTSLAPGVCLGGNTIVGNCCELGINSATKQFIKIGNNSKIGGMSVVVKNVKENSIIKGIPAK